MKSRQSLHKLIFTFTTLACLTACGGEKGLEQNDSEFAIIETAIPGVYFEIPEGALPAGLDPVDIKIEPTSAPPDLAKSMDDTDIQAWKLIPDGTRFEKPVRVVVPFNEVLPSFLHIYNGEQSWVADVIYKLSPQGHTASVSLEHFSDLVVGGGTGWRQAFEFSAAVPDTQVGELVDAGLTVSMVDFFVTDRERRPGQGHQREPEESQVFVVPGSKTACSGRAFEPCSVFSDSENLEPKDIDAFRNATNIQAEPLPFEKQFSLSFGGYRCADVGTAVIHFNFHVEWLGEWKWKERDFGHTIPFPSYTSMTVVVPLNCVERTVVALMGVEQSVSVNAYSLEASNRAEVNETRDDKFQWSAWDDEDTDMHSTGTGSVSTNSEVSIPAGLESLARLTTNTGFHGPILAVDGHLSLNLQGMADIDRRKWGVLGSAEAEMTLSAAIRAPSIVTITNCALFEQSTFQQFADYQYSDARCTFRVDGASTLELPSVGELPGISLPRASESLGGQIIVFTLDAYRSTEEPLNESFRIVIRPDKHLSNTFFPDEDLRVLLR